MIFKNTCFWILFIFFSSLLTAQNPIRFIHTYGGFSYNYGMCVHQEADTGYVILANVSGTMGNNNVQLFKIDKYGTYVWNRLYSDSAVFWAEKMTKTPDNGFLITGYTNKINANGYDVFLYKTDSLGNKEWERYYGGNNWDFGLDVAISSDNNYVVCGSTYSFGNGQTDMYLLKLNLIGDTLWTRTFGGAYEEEASCISVCANGDILIAGQTKSFGNGSDDALLVRYDNNGNFLWHQTYGGAESEKIYGVFELYNQDIVLGGHTASYGNGGDDYYLIYTNASGTQQWYKADGGPDDERALTLALTADSGYVLTGLTTGAGYQDLYFYKMKANGDWHYSTAHGGPYNEYASSIKQALDGGYIIVGSTEGFGPALSNIFVVKTGIDGLSEPYNSITENTTKKTSLKIYPNPFIVSARVDISMNVNKKSVFTLYNTLGNSVLYKEIESKTTHFYLERGHLPCGIYYYQWDNGTGISCRGKIVIAD